jgi:hypothetical protein
MAPTTQRVLRAADATPANRPSKSCFRGSSVTGVGNNREATAHLDRVEQFAHLVDPESGRALHIALYCRRRFNSRTGLTCDDREHGVRQNRVQRHLGVPFAGVAVVSTDAAQNDSATGPCARPARRSLLLCEVVQDCVGIPPHRRRRHNRFGRRLILITIELQPNSLLVSLEASPLRRQNGKLDCAHQLSFVIL